MINHREGDEELKKLADLIVNMICGPIPDKNSPLNNLTLSEDRCKSEYKDGEWSFTIKNDNL